MPFYPFIPRNRVVWSTHRCMTPFIMKTLLPIVFLLAIACGQHPPSGNFGKIEKKTNVTFQQQDIMGYSTDSRLEEVSGLVASRKNPGFLWAHNDSGNSRRIYLLNPEGEVVLTVALRNIRNLDWEDIAISNGTEPFLFIADIGDNQLRRDYVTIYRIPEPQKTDQEIIAIAAVDKMHVSYREGSRDAETLLFDPISQELILLTKRDPQSMVYSFSFEPDLYQQLDSKGNLPVTGLTGGDINAMGQILVKNYNHLFLVRNPGQLRATEVLLTQTFEKLKYKKEKQGEAVAWSIAGDGFFLLSEWHHDTPQPLYYYH